MGDPMNSAGVPLSARESIEQFFQLMLTELPAGE